MRGLDYEKKSFSVPMSGGAIVLSREEEIERDNLKREREEAAEKVRKETQERLARLSSQKVTRKLVPYGTRILVKRRKVEDKSSHIILPDEVKNLPTDIADVVAVPEQTLVDKGLISNSDKIISALEKKANEGDSSALEALLKFRDYLQVMTIKPGDVLLMARYGGTDFLIQETNQTLCVCDPNGIYCLVIEKKV